MIRQLLLPAMAGLLLVACGQGERVSDLVSEEDLDRIESELPDEAESLSPAEQAEAETPDADAVLQRWARAMEARNWEEARQVWGDKGEASGLSAEDYAEAHEKYRTVKIEVGEGRAEGAAGTLYYEAEVTQTGQLQNGDAYLMKGPVVLSRVNNVPGASDEDLAWHIEMSDLRPRPVDEETGEPQ